MWILKFHGKRKTAGERFHYISYDTYIFFDIFSATLWILLNALSFAIVLTCQIAGFLRCVPFLLLEKKCDCISFLYWKYVRMLWRSLEKRNELCRIWQQVFSSCSYLFLFLSTCWCLCFRSSVTFGNLTTTFLLWWI